MYKNQLATKSVTVPLPLHNLSNIFLDTFGHRYTICFMHNIFFVNYLIFYHHTDREIGKLSEE